MFPLDTLLLRALPTVACAHSRMLALKEPVLFARRESNHMVDTQRFVLRWFQPTVGTASTTLCALVSIVTVCSAVIVRAEPVAVRHPEGIVHGFLVLRTLDGKAVADGDLIQNARGNRVTTRLTYHFKDGSTHDETAVYTQGREFKLVSDHLVQKGPTFPTPLDMSIEAATGRVTVRYTDGHGQQKTESEHLDLPADLANGLILTLMKNVHAEALPHAFSYVAATPKPRLVKLVPSTAGEDSFSTGASGRRATHYTLKVDIGGVKELLAELLGKEPPDSQVWILAGEAPAFVKSEQFLYLGGPILRTELTNPVWPRASEARLK